MSDPKDTIPYGFCHCGCGEKTNLARTTDPKKGWVRHQPIKYVAGHNARKSPVEYVIDPETGCWVWQRYVSSNGYGRMRIGDRLHSAHRVFYSRARGPIPEGLQLDHICRNRKCVNPDHLFLGTVKDNSDDMIAKERAAWQKDHSAHVRAYKAATIRRNPNGSANSRLTTAQVVEIKKRLAAGEKQSAISADYGVCKTAITHINTGRRWGHVSLE